MKMQDPTHVTIGEREFHIFPFPAFKCANLSGELASLILPLLTAAAGLKDGLDTDLSKIGPVISEAFSNLSGDKVESFLRKLLIDNKNISVTPADGGKAVWLTEEIANEVFCGEMQDMFILAFYVIKLNFSGFFKRLDGQFGTVVEKLTKKTLK